jgi:Glycosyltransferase WbsX
MDGGGGGGGYDINNNNNGAGPSTFFEDLVKKSFTMTSSSSSLSSSKLLRPSNPEDQIKKGGSKSQGGSNMPRVLAIYFPQYHPDPLNDKNWGDNFTDWVSLQKSPSKNRDGYPIPRPLQDEFDNGLGYYDLQNTAPRKRQGQLATQYGVDGFIYHHYWFYDPTHPGPNLEKPLLNMLKDGHPDRPFFLNWCAVKWSNVWMGKTIFQKIPTNKNRAITLQEQYFEPTLDEIREHYNWLSQFFHHPNYIRMNGGTQPALMMYNYDDRAVPILQQLRQFAIEDGFTSLYLIVGRSGVPLGGLYDTAHLDGRSREVFETTHQLPEYLPLQTVYGRETKTVDITTSERVAVVKRATQQDVPKTAYRNKTVSVDVVFNQSMTYPYPLQYIDQPFEVPQWCRRHENPPSLFIPEMTGVITVFDNTPRREYKTSNMYNQGPSDEVLQKFETSFHAALYYQKCCVNHATVATYSGDDSGTTTNTMEERFVAINAWNEWAEGMAIEPSDVYGYGWLETIQRVKRQIQDELC